VRRKASGRTGRESAEPAQSNDVERLLRSGRVPDVRPELLLVRAGEFKVEEALGDVADRLTEAQRLLAPYRDEAEARPELSAAYAAVHAAKGDLAAIRHWRVIMQRHRDHQD
jgi:hypothetical protein